jgi:hypothetical protein
MGMMTGNELLPTISKRGKKVLSAEVIDIGRRGEHSAERVRNYFRNRQGGRYSAGCTDWVRYVAPTDPSENFHILVIGDEQSGQGVRITLASHLSLPIDYLEARSGKASLQLIDREDVDLIVFGEGI